MDTSTDNQPLKDALAKQETSAFESHDDTTDRFGRGPNSMNYMDEPEYHRLADFLDLDYKERQDYKTAEKLSFLYDWAKEQTKSEDGTTNREAIRGLQRIMGITDRGQPAMKKMIQWIRLSNTIKKAEREQGLLVDEKKET